MVEIDEKQAFAIMQKAKETGTVKAGANEVTKVIERGIAKLVIAATDVSPAEIVAHLPGLSSEMNVPFISAGTKEELGQLVGIKKTTALVVTDAGSAKKELQALAAESAVESKEEKSEE